MTLCGSRTHLGMTTYDDRSRLAARADAVFGTGEAQTLMEMLSTGERLEIEIVRLRAHLDQRFAQVDQRFAQVDQRFAQIDQKFVDLQRDILAGVDARLVGFEDRVEAKLAGLDAKFETKIDGAIRFNRGTLWSVAATIAASVVAAGAAIALAIAFG